MKFEMEKTKELKYDKKKTTDEKSTKLKKRNQEELGYESELCKGNTFKLAE